MKPPITPTTISSEPTDKRAILNACRLMRGDNPGAVGRAFWLCASGRSKRTTGQTGCGQSRHA